VEVDLLALGIQPISGTYGHGKANNNDSEADREGLTVSGRWTIFFADPTGPGQGWIRSRPVTGPFQRERGGRPESAG